MTVNCAPTYHVQLASKERRSAVLRLVGVRGVSFEELTLGLECNRDRLVLVDVPLSTVHNWYIAQSQGYDPAREDIDDVRAGIPL